MFSTLHTDSKFISPSHASLLNSKVTYPTVYHVDGFAWRANRLFKCNQSKPNSCSFPVLLISINDDFTVPFTPPPKKKTLGFFLTPYSFTLSSSPSENPINFAFEIKPNQTISHHFSYQLRSSHHHFLTELLQQRLTCPPPAGAREITIKKYDQSLMSSKLTQIKHSP